MMAGFVDLVNQRRAARSAPGVGAVAGDAVPVEDDLAGCGGAGQLWHGHGDLMCRRLVRRAAANQQPDDGGAGQSGQQEHDDQTYR